MATTNNDESSVAAQPPVNMEPDYRVISGFWRRLVAAILDSLLLGLLGFVLGLLLFHPFARLGGWGRLLGFSVTLVYFGCNNLFISRYQRNVISNTRTYFENDFP